MRINSVIEVTQLQSTWQKTYRSTADYENGIIAKWRAELLPLVNTSPGR